MALITQETLLKSLKSIYPEHEIQQNVRKKLNLKYDNSIMYMECDLWLPDLQLGFEFQDEHHYTSTWYCNRKLETVVQKDADKQEKMRHIGMYLITVPCWWDGGNENLIAQIKFHRPDIPFSQYSEVYPYSLNPPRNYFEDMTEVIPDIGNLMLVSYPHGEFSVAGHDWWMGEKYDGIRCCWNSLNRTAYTRQGNKIELLPPFINFLPSIFVDGEIWFGRGQFNTCFFLINGSMQHFHWPNLRLLCFDDPASSECYEQRYAHLVQNIAADHPFNAVASRMLVSGSSELYKQMKQNTVSLGGEGLIMQACGSMYENGLRSNSLLKLKANSSEREGIITKIDKISVTVKQPDDSTVLFMRENVMVPSVAVGDIVTFEFEVDAKSDKPKNAKIVRIRNDLSWEDVIHSHFYESHRHPGSWMSEQDRRQFFIDFAKKNDFDPLNRDNWYSQVAANILLTKGARQVMFYHKNKLHNALIDLFPDIGLERSKLNSYESWQSFSNRRQFFINYAKKHGFDPLKSKNWYAQTRASIYQMKGGFAILSHYYDNKLANALVDLFPDIGLDQSSKELWKSKRRQFFMNYAKKHAFDPLLPENWYAQTITNVTMKGSGMLHYFNEKLSGALLALFPNIGLDVSKFTTKVIKGTDMSGAHNFETFMKTHKFRELWRICKRDSVLQKNAKKRRQ